MTTTNTNTSFDLSRDTTLVGIEVSLYPWSKKDTVSAHNAAQAESADDKRFTAYIQRVSQADRLPPQKIIGEARKCLAFPNGTPWDGKGFFLIPNTRLEATLDKLKDFQNKFYAAVEDIVRRLPELEAQARVDLNGAFDRLGFPTVDDIKERYSFRVRQSAIVNPQDIRLNHVSPAARASIEAAVRRELSDKSTELHKSCVEGIAAALRRVVDSLPAFTAGKISRFEDTLITGLQDITEALPALNLGNDSNLTRAIAQSQALVASLTKANEGATLRNKNEEGAKTRKALAGQAKSILDSLKTGAVKPTI
jgi:hypothetical protein